MKRILLLCMVLTLLLVGCDESSKMRREARRNTIALTATAEAGR